MKRNALYTLPATIKQREKADQAFWMKDAVIIALVLGLSALDAITLYTVFDTVMYQSQVVCMVLTVGCALALNFIPLIIGRFIHLYRYHLQGIRMWMIVALVFVFLILFATSFYLRWETRHISFAGLESTMTDTTGQAQGISGTESTSKEAAAITILLGILPGVTSAINLALGYLTSDPIKKKISKLKTQKAALLEQLDIMKAAEKELDIDWTDQLTTLDHQRYEAACEQVKAGSGEIRAYARQELAKKLGDPESMSYILDHEENGTEGF